MRSGQDGRTRPAEEGGERVQGQYEKDPWRPDCRSEPFEAGDPREEGDCEEGDDEESLEPDRRAGPRYPPGPKGYQRSDERLREDISERLLVVRYIDSSGVTVEVSGAKVVLDGTVPERPMKHAIEDLVDACPGVQDIENRIRVKR